MRRRDFLVHLSTAVPAAACVTWPRLLRAAEPPLPPGWRSFEIVTSVEVAAPAGHTQLWLPMPVKAASDYQRLLSMNWDAPGAMRAELVVIPDYDVRLLHVDWPDAGAVGPVTLTYRVATCDRRVSLTAPSRVAVRSGGLSRHARGVPASDAGSCRPTGSCAARRSASARAIKG